MKSITVRLEGDVEEQFQKFKRENGLSSDAEVLRLAIMHTKSTITQKIEA